jgi:Mrp family chromosome partitioning ATPase
LAAICFSGKKVLLIGMDIRNPRLDDYLTLPDLELLSSKDTDRKNLIVKHPGFEDFNVLPRIIPPNPAELLMNKSRFSFETLKIINIDYIIVDTAS